MKHHLAECEQKNVLYWSELAGGYVQLFGDVQSPELDDMSGRGQSHSSFLNYVLHTGLSISSKRPFLGPQ